VTTCNPDGSNRNVTVANYTCIPGVAIKTSAPVYCLLDPSVWMASVFLSLSSIGCRF
jgi:hypothetical protein